MLALTILGNNSAVPAFGRNPTAQVLQTLEETYLIDCGEGTQMQMAKYKIRRSKISRIFISHLHGDHYFGLIGLLTSMSLLGRTQDLHLHAPRELEEIINWQFKVGAAKLSYNLIFHAITEDGLIADDKNLTVHAFKVKHRIECFGFLFKQKTKLRNINVERTKAYEIPTSFYQKLQQGEDYINKKGTVIPNEEVTFAPIPPKSYAYSADTLYCEDIIDKVKNVDLLYHEATYLKLHEERALLHFHSTTIQAATIAQKAEVKRLLIGHFSSKYEVLDEFRNEAREVFPNTDLALEGICYKI
ncbi:ribonuclease Z [Ferruginibacter albus]|uniref:ribonuclease Z n=1 Tax=Ferruginibacter albus TaxID=2875540 RepID=UPI001CC36EE9|nr:ribonuclease Z [Ferruginibacter albus]UAY51109.1 ribonuclease Z [Ferruginibacter albus]